MSAQLYSELNKAWKSTCRILFGEEIGELKDNEDWLAEYANKPRKAKSNSSGKDVYVAVDEYCKGANFIGSDEIDYNKRFEPLGINEIKDIDSIVEALHERSSYAGNLVLGNSRFIERSSNITDGTYISDTCFVDGSQYIAHSSYFRESKYIFGSRWGAFSNYLIRNRLVGPNVQRAFEAFWALESSDIYYSANIEGCMECMFCFNLKGRRRSIGNLELPSDKYLRLKKKLVSEIVADLKKGRRTSLCNLMSVLPKEKLELKRDLISEDKFDALPVDNSFRKTFGLIFGKDPGALSDYEEYLQKRLIPRMVSIKDTASRNDITYSEMQGAEDVPKHRLISEAEAMSLVEVPVSLNESEAEELSMKNPGPLSKVAFMPFGMTTGRNRNIGKSLWNYNATDCCGGLGFVESKNSAYCFWPRNSSYLFGSYQSFESSFCINTYHSKKLSRSFEADSCTNCSDVYFAHNCENVHDSMFCFNSKNLRNAVGNAVLSPDKYRSVKQSIVRQLADELVSKKDLEYDIFNIGCGRP